MKPLCRVTIGGTTYNAVAIVSSGSRGEEFKLADEDGNIVRVCHAPLFAGPGKMKAFTSGEEILYDYGTDTP